MKSIFYNVSTKTTIFAPVSGFEALGVFLKQVLMYNNFEKFKSSCSLNNVFKTTFRPWYKETSSTVLKDVVIVLDKSKSMQGYLPQVKAAVKAVLNTLGPNDRVK